MNKIIDLENVEDNNESSDSDIEIKPSKKVYTMKKERAPYVYTEARQQAFEKAKEAREVKRDERKLIKQQLEETTKKELEDKIFKKADNIKKKIAKKEKILNVEPDEEEPEPEIVIKKKPKKKIIIIEDSSDEEIVVKKKKNIKSLPLPIVKKYVPVYY